MDQTLIKTLEDTGFTNKEAVVYLALLELSKGNVTDIAKKTDLKRSIIYVILERLIKDGYVTELPNKKIYQYQALDPSVILQKAKISTRNLAEMLPLLQTLHNKGGQRPIIHYIETKEGILKIFNEMTDTKDGMFITSYHRINEQFSKLIEKFIKDATKGFAKLKGRHIVPNNPEEIILAKKLKQTDQQIRLLPESNQINLDFAIFKNKFAITSFEEKPFMVLIESESLVSSMKVIFEIVWMSSKEITNV
jgi:sugar-specific transcriptional regulator TrmB